MKGLGSVVSVPAGGTFTAEPSITGSFFLVRQKGGTGTGVPPRRPGSDSHRPVCSPLEDLPPVGEGDVVVEVLFVGSCCSRP
jgi:hypothetical protein